MDKKAFIKELTSQIHSGDIDSYDIPDELEGYKLKVEEEWGGEGEGSNIGYVLDVTSPSGEKFFVSVDGYYESNMGSDYSYADVAEVEPYMKQVRDWRAI